MTILEKNELKYQTGLGENYNMLKQPKETNIIEQLLKSCRVDLAL